MRNLNGYYKWILTAFRHRGRPAPSCQGQVFLCEGIGHGTIRLDVAQAMRREGLLQFSVGGTGGMVQHWELTQYGQSIADKIHERH